MESLTIPVRVFGIAEASPGLFVDLSGICIWAATSIPDNATLAIAPARVLFVFIGISLSFLLKWVLRIHNP